MAQTARFSSPAALRRLADGLEPRLRRQFLAAVAKLQGRISLAALARAVELGGLTIALSQALNAWPRDLQPAVRTLNDAFAEAAKRTAKTLPAPLRLRTSFTLTNPFAVQAADTGTARMVREVTQKTRRAIQETIARAIREGIPPKVAAKTIAPLVGLTNRQAQAVLNARARLMVKGLSGDRLIAQTTRYAQRLLRLRAETIARTEIIRASNDGQLALWRRARANGFLDSTARKRWITAQDERLCELCRPLQGVEVPLDQAFPGGVQAPPRHPRCRCAVVLTAARQRRAA
jgi:SPP1 gp7 family putative phage head morphogenesis protein